MSKRAWGVLLRNDTGGMRLRSGVGRRALEKGSGGGVLLGGGVGVEWRKEYAFEKRAEGGMFDSKQSCFL